jgi:hypothetical protein
MVYWLVNGLRARGHDVTMITAGRKHTPARFLQTFSKPPRPPVGPARRAGSMWRRWLPGTRAPIVAHWSAWQRFEARQPRAAPPGAIGTLDAPMPYGRWNVSVMEP